MENKIFCIGLPKTGTTSFASSLQKEGYNLIGWPWNSETIKELKMGNFNLSILKSCDGLQDMIPAIYYKEIYNFYPNSKFVLTTREKKEWLLSCDNWWKKQKLNTFEKYNSSENLRFLKPSLFGTYFYSQERFSNVYDTHRREVEHFFSNKKNQLLILPLELSDHDKALKVNNFLNLNLKKYERVNVSRGIK